MTSNAWEEFDKAQEGTVYWTYITSPELEVQERLIGLLKTYPLLSRQKEFIMHPQDAIALIGELSALGVAVDCVSVWCAVSKDELMENCCPDGIGGTQVNGETFLEYTHLGSCVPNFETIPRTCDLAQACNAFVRTYIETQFLYETGSSNRFRVSLSLYVPLCWNLFPNS